MTQLHSRASRIRLHFRGKMSHGQTAGRDKQNVAESFQSSKFTNLYLFALYFTVSHGPAAGVGGGGKGRQPLVSTFEIREFLPVFRMSNLQEVCSFFVETHWDELSRQQKDFLLGRSAAFAHTSMSC